MAGSGEPGGRSGETACVGAAGAFLVRRFRLTCSVPWLWLAIALCAAVAIVDAVEVTRGIYHNVRNWALPYALLGDASFSIYLTHYYLIWEINGRLFQYSVIARTVGYDGQRVIVLIMVFAIGIACLALIGRPLLRLFRQGSGRRESIGRGDVAFPDAARTGIVANP